MKKELNGINIRLDIIKVKIDMLKDKQQEVLKMKHRMND